MVICVGVAFTIDRKSERGLSEDGILMQGQPSPSFRGLLSNDTWEEQDCRNSRQGREVLIDLKMLDLQGNGVNYFTVDKR